MVLPLFESGELSCGDITAIFNEYRNDDERLILDASFLTYESLSDSSMSYTYARYPHLMFEDMKKYPERFNVKHKKVFVKMCKRGTELYQSRVKNRFLPLLETCNRCNNCGHFFHIGLDHCPECYSTSFQEYSIPEGIEVSPWAMKTCLKCGWKTQVIFREKCPKCGNNHLALIPVSGETKILLITLTQAIVECLDCGKYSPESVDGRNLGVCIHCRSTNIHHRDIKESWVDKKKGISHTWTLFNKSLVGEFGKIEYMRVWESRDDYMPHTHALIVFKEHRFKIMQHIDENGDLSYRLVDPSDSEKIKSFWHSFVDIKGVTSIKAGVSEIVKYLLDLSSEKGDKTHSMVWLFNMQSYAITRGFLTALDEKLVNIDLSEPGEADLISDFMHNCRRGFLTLRFVGVMPDRLLGISGDILRVEMDRPPPRIEELLKHEAERQYRLRLEREGDSRKRMYRYSGSVFRILWGDDPSLDNLRKKWEEAFKSGGVVVDMEYNKTE
jgi:uncharacterized OB-fold protein